MLRNDQIDITLKSNRKRKIDEYLLSSPSNKNPSFFMGNRTMNSFSQHLGSDRKKIENNSSNVIASNSFTTSNKPLEANTKSLNKKSVEFTEEHHIESN